MKVRPKEESSYDNKHRSYTTHNNHKEKDKTSKIYYKNEPDVNTSIKIMSSLILAEARQTGENV